jgi:hypothetical protein
MDKRYGDWLDLAPAESVPEITNSISLFLSRVFVLGNTSSHRGLLMILTKFLDLTAVHRCLCTTAAFTDIYISNT